MKRSFRLWAPVLTLMPLLFLSCNKENGSSSGGDSPAIKTADYVQVTLDANLPKKSWTTEDQIKAWSSAQAYRPQAMDISKDNPETAKLTFDLRANIQLLGYPYDKVPEMSNG